MKIFYLLLFSFFLSFLSLSQESNLLYEQLDLKSSTYNQETYCLLKDRTGDIWVGTDQGILRFSHNEITTYSTEDGLPDNTIFQILEDASGRLWSTSISGSPTYFENDSWHHLPAHASIDSFMLELGNRNTGRYFPYSIYVDTVSNGVTISTFRPTNYLIHTYLDSDKIEFVNINRDSILGEIYRAYMMLDSDGEVIMSGLSGDVPLHRSFDEKYIYRTHDTTLSRFGNDDRRIVQFTIGFVPEAYYWSQRRVYATTVHNGSRYVSRGRVLLRFRESGFDVIDILPGDIICINEYGDDLFIGTDGHGLFRYKFEGDTLALNSTHFPNYTITDLLRVSEQQYWIATLNHGIITLPSFDAIHFQIPYKFEPDLMSRPFGVIGNQIISTKKGSILRFKIPEESEIEVSLVDSVPYATGMTRSQQNWNGHVLINNFTRLTFNDTSQTIEDIIPTQLSSLYKGRNRLTYSSADYSRVYTLSMESAFVFTHDGDVLRTRHTSRDVDVNSLLMGGDSLGWVGAFDGIYRVIGDSLLMEAFPNFPPANQRIIDLQSTSTSWNIASTKSQGILIFNKDSIFQLTSADALICDQIMQLTTHNNTFYAWCPNGLFIGELSDDGLYSYKHLPANLIPQVKIVREMVANDDGLYLKNLNDIYFLPSILLNSNIPANTFEIEHISVNDVNLDCSSFHQLNIKRGANNIFIQLKSSGPIASTNNLWKWRVSGDDSWRYTSNGEIQLYNLSSGHYALEAMHRDQNGQWSEPIEITDFNIRKPIIQTVWFWILISSPLLLFIISSILTSERRRRQSRQLIESNMATLKMQINPHFIFNAFNSIQYLISSKRNDAASEYLNRLAVLIRKTISRPDLHRVSLEEELQYIQEYMSIELMRMEHQFHFHLEIDENVQVKSHFIPPMLLQPLLENAVWHGVSDTHGNGIVTLKVEQHLNGIKIHIQDNGDGFPRDKWEALLEGNSTSGSLGLLNVLQRLRLLSELENKTHRLELLSDSNGTHFVMTIDH